MLIYFLVLAAIFATIFLVAMVPVLAAVFAWGLVWAMRLLSQVEVADDDTDGE